MVQMQKMATSSSFSISDLDLIESNKKIDESPPESYDKGSSQVVIPLLDWFKSASPVDIAWVCLQTAVVVLQCTCICICKSP